jgi:hypothetical protein
MPGHARAIDAKQVYSQQFRASEVRAVDIFNSRASPHWGEAGLVGGRGEHARHHHCARSASVAGGSADFGQWENQPPHVRAWFQKLMQPDLPTMSCCGEADAYWADSFEVDGDRYVAVITDERPDGPLGRPHRESGEKIVVPNHKIKWDDGNPTGHGIIFIGMGGQVYCYVPPGGV